MPPPGARECQRDHNLRSSSSGAGLKGVKDEHAPSLTVLLSFTTGLYPFEQIVVAAVAAKHFRYITPVARGRYEDKNAIVLVLDLWKWQRRVQKQSHFIM